MNLRSALVGNTGSPTGAAAALRRALIAIRFARRDEIEQAHCVLG